MTWHLHRWLVLALALLVLWPVAGAAVEPDEMLKDPAQEARAREISKEIRCLVCRNESIDDSNAGLARDLRLLVRERIEAGDSDEEVKDYLVARFGEFVLLKPRFSPANAFLWLAGPVLFVIGLVAAIVFMRRRRTATGTDRQALSEEERAELDRILKE